MASIPDAMFGQVQQSVGGLAMGHVRAADLRLTPEHPIGFQADGNGWFPGATPAVAEWWDGTPGRGKVATREGMGNQLPPLAGRAPAEDKLAARYAEDIARQIAERKGEGKTPPPPTAPEGKR